MSKTMMIVLSGILLLLGILATEASERVPTALAFAIMSSVVVFLYRRFRRSAGEVPWVCHAAAAIGITLGVITMTTGLAHSAAVTAVAFREGEWSPLTILRFTTGAMLLYAGAMSVALHRAIRAGHHWALRVVGATTLFFWMYLMLLFPLPGTGGTVPPMLGLWSAYLVWLAAAAIAPEKGTCFPFGFRPCKQAAKFT